MSRNATPKARTSLMSMAIMKSPLVASECPHMFGYEALALGPPFWRASRIR